jgi:hypothetical protein
MEAYIGAARVEDHYNTGPLYAAGRHLEGRSPPNPIHGEEESAGDTVGWTAYDADGRTLPVGNPFVIGGSALRACRSATAPMRTADSPVTMSAST